MKVHKILFAAAICTLLQIVGFSQTVSFTGGTLTQNFDSMGTTGTNTPLGWYVGSNGVSAVVWTTNVTVNNGGAGLNAAVSGFNLGTNGANALSDRALGTGPTGRDRYMEVRIANNSGNLITNINVLYDGEQWRSGSSATVKNTLVLQYSADGVNYTDAGASFNFVQPTYSPVNVALDGNRATNRIPGIGGTFILPAAVPAGGVMHIRWFDFNDASTDPILAIDNFSFSVGYIPPTIQITSPTNNQTFAVSSDVAVTTSTGGIITNITYTVNGTVVTNRAGPPYSIVLDSELFPSPGDYTLRAVALDSSGVQVQSNPVLIHFVENQGPSIEITNVFSGTVTGNTFAVGSPITFQVRALDDVSVTNVDWYVDNLLTFSRATPFTFIYVDSLAGNHEIRAVASDKAGLTASATVTITVTNPPAPQYTVLIANGSEWSYWATNSAPPDDTSSLSWYQAGYDDSGWGAGLGEFGNGDAADGYPERTMIDLGPSNNRYRTVYFRRTLFVEDPALYQNLVLNLLFDDGAVVYINGNAVWTNNIANTDIGISYTNLANGAISETVYQTVNLSPFVLDQNPNSVNTIAVEVHQQNATSSDLSFDLMLWGEQATIPTISISTPTNNQSFKLGSTVTVNATASTFVTNLTLFLDEDPTPVGFDGAKPFSIGVSNLTLGTHTLTLTGDDEFAGPGSVVASVTIQIVPNAAPSVTVGTPVSGSSLLVGGNILVTNVTATDPDGTVARVDFYLDDGLVFTVNASPYWMQIGDMPAGNHTIRAVAVDNSGAFGTNSVSVIVTNPPGMALLVTNRATWRYFDLGIDPGAGWFNRSFPAESSWSLGVAELGFGDSAQRRPEQTIIARTNAAGGTNIAFYFRHHFTVPDPGAYGNLIVNLLRDDGGIVYLNGTEIYRNNMSNTPPTFTTFSSDLASDDGAIYQRSTNVVNPSLLVAGDNVVAVEIHQDSLGSSDISFDLMLWATTSSGPRLNVALNGSQVNITWQGSGYTLQQNSNVGNPNGWAPVSGAQANSYSFTPAANQPVLFFRLYK